VQCTYLTLSLTFYPHMENIDRPLDDAHTYPPQKDLELTEEIATYWLSTSSWAFFFSVLLFLISGILLIVSFISMSRDIGPALVMLGISILMAVPAMLLWQFQAKLKKALYDESAETLQSAFRAFRHLYILAGVFTILFTVVYLISLAYTFYQLQQHSYIEETPEF
jgi:hypothetical protein